jgi:hypothetical protein
VASRRAERAIRKECTLHHEQETLEQSALEHTTFSMHFPLIMLLMNYNVMLLMDELVYNNIYVCIICS